MYYSKLGRNLICSVFWVKMKLLDHFKHFYPLNMMFSSWDGENETKIGHKNKPHLLLLCEISSLIPKSLIFSSSESEYIDLTGEKSISYIIKPIFLRGLQSLIQALFYSANQLSICSTDKSGE